MFITFRVGQGDSFLMFFSNSFELPDLIHFIKFSRHLAFKLFLKSYTHSAHLYSFRFQIQNTCKQTAYNCLKNF